METQIKNNTQQVTKLQGYKVSDLRNELIDGLQHSSKRIPNKFLFDKYGSLIFELLLQTDEYYLAPLEKEIINNLTPIFSNFNNVELIDLGCSNSSTINTLLNIIPYHRQHTITYHPFDLSAIKIENAITGIRKRFPNIMINPEIGHFTYDTPKFSMGKNKVFCFFGSKIGLLEPKQSLTFCTHLNHLLEAGDQLFISFDLIKTQEKMEAVYNDSQRFCEALNRNSIRVTNNLLKSELIPSYFEHKAHYNINLNRIEMYLKAKHPMELESPYLTQAIVIKENETIHTEYAYKYTVRRIYELLRKSKLRVEKIHFDENKQVAIAHIIK